MNNPKTSLWLWSIVLLCSMFGIELKAQDGCQISDLNFNEIECIGDKDRITGIVNFKYETVNNNSFDLFFEGELISSHRLEELPLLVDLPYIQSFDFLDLRVCINDRPDCCAEVVFAPPICNSTCPFKEINSAFEGCKDSSELVIGVSFESFVTQGQFGVSINGGQAQFFDFLTQTTRVSIPYSEAGLIEFYVFDPITECGERFQLYSRRLDLGENGLYCEDSEHVLDATIGDSDATYLWNTGESTPQIIATYSGEYSVTVISPECGVQMDNVAIEYYPFQCDTTTTCFASIFVEQTPCDPQTGAFFIEITLPGAENKLGGFQASVNGRNQGRFLYRNVPRLRLGPFSGIDSVVYDLLLQDLVDQTCIYQEQVVPCLPDCPILGIEAHAYDCDLEDGSFMLNIFVSSSQFDGEFNLRGNGRDYGTYSYANSIVTIGPLNSLIDIVYEFIATDVETGCSKFTALSAPCSREACPLDAIRFELTPCDSTESFDIIYTIENPDRFSPEQTFTIGGINFIEANIPYNSGEGVLEGLQIEDDFLFTFLRDDQGLCTRIDTITSPCFEDPCPLRLIDVTPLECNEETFLVELSVNTPYPSFEEFYEVFINAEHFGIFSYLESIITIDSVPRTANEVYIIEVHDIQRPYCIDRLDLELDCSTICVIQDVKLRQQPCDALGNFLVDVFVSSSDNAQGEYRITATGKDFGTFSYTENEVTIGPFDSSLRNIFGLVVADTNHPDSLCRIERILEIDCEPFDCHLTDVVVETHPCEDNEYLIDIEVQTDGLTGSSFFVQINDGQRFGPFSYDLPFITLGPFSTPNLYIVVSDKENLECVWRLDFNSEDCANECQITEVRVDTGDCNESGNFPIVVDFDVRNPQGYGFSIMQGNNLLGFYPYGALPITIPNFNNSGFPIAELLVIAGNDICGKEVLFDAPACSIDSSGIYPGDTNNDNISHHIDLLNIGLAFGATGPARADSSIAWQEMHADDWDRRFENGLNYKFADANGDGQINQADVIAIEQNYGRTHGDLPDFLEDAFSSTDNEFAPTIYADFSTVRELPIGAAFTIPIILGSDSQSVQEIYGIAFSLRFDPNIIDPNSIVFDIPYSWLGIRDENLLTIQKVYAEEGLIEVAITRTDGKNVTGYGTIALFSGAIDDVIGIRATDINIERVRAINEKNVIIPITGLTNTVMLTSNKEIESSADNISVFPNPTTGTIHLINKDELTIQVIEVFDSRGQQITQIQQPTDHINLEQYPTGLYYLHIKTSKGNTYQRIVKE